MTDGKRSQSIVSDDLDGSDLDLPPSNKKSKESSRDTDQRKVQNRIAQREFRQRKQQYIKDLEARLEILQAAPNEQLEQLRVGIRALLDENQQLRTLLASVSGFIGEGIGGLVPKLGVELPEFNAILGRSRTDLVHEALDAHHATQQKKNNNDDHPPDSVPPPPRPDLSLTFSNSTPPISRPDLAHHSPHPPPVAGPSRPTPHHLPSHSPALPIHRAASTPSVPPQPITPRLPSAHTGGSPYQVGHSPADGGYGVSPAGSAAGPAAGRSPSAQDKLAIAKSEDWLKQGALGGQQSDVDVLAENVQQMFSMPTDNPKLQAIQLISYHMRNKRDNPSYKLPPSLRATITQSSVPHSPFFDGIIFASLRDRLILLKDQYDLATLLGDLIEAFSIHGQDCLVPQNWELSEGFLRKYWYVIDPEVLEIANRWRRERGEPELAMRDIVP